MKVFQRSSQEVDVTQGDNANFRQEFLEVLNVFKFDLEDVEFGKIQSLLTVEQFKVSFTEAVATADEKKVIGYFKGLAQGLS
jgi:hypothetical protein